MANFLSVAVGVDLNPVITLKNQDTDTVTTFTLSDTPYAEVWGGLDTPVILTPTCEWIDPTQGQFVIAISGSATASITPGRYQIRYGVITAAGQKLAAPDQAITFTDSPGVSGSLSVYCTYQDMLDFDPGVEQLQTEEDLAGFVRQRHRARQWLERIIQRHNTSTGFNSFGTSLFGYSIGGDSAGASGATNSVLQGYLDNNYLLLSEQVTAITAKYSLYLVYNAKVGPDDKMTVWQRLAAQWYADVQREVLGYTAEIYLPGNTTAPLYVIPCGRVSLR